jgi:MFS family permease
VLALLTSRPDPARVALLASAFALPYALVQPVLGPVADAWGKQRVILFALAFQAVFLFASALAPTLMILLVLRALTGAAGGGVFPSPSPCSATVCPSPSARWRSRASSPAP